MPTISSHVLDSIAGKSATGVLVKCFRLGDAGSKTEVFNVVSDEEGRISQTFALSTGLTEETFELEFFTQSYFESAHPEIAINQNMCSAIARFSLSERERKFHIPLVLSPHSYTFWWSD